jgi:class 3 adenylate cyclase/alpha-beta hydrolase superfamily lysophospholipase
MAPRIQYARSGDVHIAYATVGEGPLDVVFVPGFVSSLESTFADMDSGLGALVERLSRFARVTTFDKRGTGLSDRSVGIAGLEERMDDVRSVMDAVGIDHAHLLGVSEGGPMSILFAATFPDRTLSLTLCGSFASFVRTADHPWMPTLAERAKNREMVEALWGQGRVLGRMFPRNEVTPEVKERLASAELRSASPGAVVQLLAMNEEIDVRAILPTIAVPTLVVHDTGDETVPFPSGEYLAEHIPGARLLPQHIGAHISADPGWLDWLSDFEEFTTGARPAEFTDRVLSTVLFSDIVGSTDLAVKIGDDAWRQLLDRHDEIVRREISRCRGQQVKHTGDGVLARFDGPARAVACGLAIAESLRPLGIAVRTGVHTGEIELRGDDIGGIGVHVGARIMALAQPDEVLVSRTVRDLTAGSGLSFADHGEHELKGIPDRWQVYRAAS